MCQGFDVFQGIIRKLATMIFEILDGGLQAIKLQESWSVVDDLIVIQEGKTIVFGQLVEFDVEVFSGDLFFLKFHQVFIGWVFVIFAKKKGF